MNEISTAVAATPVAAPHTFGARSIGSVMAWVMVALAPATLFGFWLYGWPAIYLWLVTVGFSLAGALILAAALTIGNVVRLALNARHDEIEIMHLVGAPTTYVRGPFVMEGALHGGLGALVALVALAATYALLRTPFLVPLASALNLSTVRFLPAPVALSLLAGGLGVGALAGVIASRRA